MSYDDMPNYDEEAVQPMRDELVNVGFEELRQPEQVDSLFAESKGTAVVIVNSVCGCAAGGARPGVSLALQNEKIPDRLATVFAGQDKAAVRRLREKLSGFPPSSPFIAVLKDGSPVKVMQRHDIEGKDAARIARELADAFDAHCGREGPSIPKEQFEKLATARVCGSTIPRNTVQIEGLGAPGGSAAGHAGHGAHGAHDEGGERKPWWQLFK